MKEWKYSNPEFECDKLNYELLKFAPWSGHRNFVYDFMSYLEPEVVVELGSHYGCSAFTFAQAAKDSGLSSKMFFIDTWQGDDFTKKYDNDVYTVFTKTVKEFYNSRNINMMRMTFDEAVDKFQDKSIDLIHIDGSHHYDDVRRDFETWLPKVKDTGIIILHDVSSDIVLGDVMGSYKYWLELKKKYVYTMDFDFSWGLGIIFLNEKMYTDFKNSGFEAEKYQRLNNALDVEYKDQLRKDYFELKDKQIYIDDLLKQKEVLSSHIEAYKKDMAELKNTYEINRSETIKAYEEERDKLVTDFENQIQEVQKSYSQTIEGKDRYISELENTNKGLVAENVNLHSETEKLSAQKQALEMAYQKTVRYKLARLKNKFIK